MGHIHLMRSKCYSTHLQEVLLLQRCFQLLEVGGLVKVGGQKLGKGGLEQIGQREQDEAYVDAPQDVHGLEKGRKMHSWMGLVELWGFSKPDAGLNLNSV